MNDKEFRQHLAELLARQRNPDQPGKKNSPTPALPPKPTTMSNKEFRKHLKQLVARQGNEGQPPAVEKKPPKPEPPKSTVVIEKKLPTTETRKFNVRRKAKWHHSSCESGISESEIPEALRWFLQNARVVAANVTRNSADSAQLSFWQKTDSTLSRTTLTRMLLPSCRLDAKRRK